MTLILPEQLGGVKHVFYGGAMHHPHLFAARPQARETRVQEGGSQNPEQIPSLGRQTAPLSLRALSNTHNDALKLDDNKNRVKQILQSSLSRVERKLPLRLPAGSGSGSLVYRKWCYLNKIELKYS